MIAEVTYNSLPVKPKLQKQKNKVYGPGETVQCKGIFVARTLHKNNEYHFRVYVLKNSNSCFNLLRRDVAHSMGLVVKVEGIRDVFGTLGCVKGPPGKITLRPEAVPYCVTTAGRIPLTLMQKVESELKHMEDE